MLTEVMETPVEFVESIAAMTLSSQADQRLQSLMDRHTNGQLSSEEIAELESLVDLAESMSLIRGRACQLLGRSLPRIQFSIFDRGAVAVGSRG